ncbi:hypothetical protein [Methanococcoides burtonii]|nr:hypothetical protein [Methanococcoides burtonii]
MDTKVQAYIKKQETPQREIVEALREMILTFFPDIKEELIMSVP